MSAPTQDRDAEVAKAVVEELLDAFAGAAVGEGAADDAGRAVEVAGAAELGEEAVEAEGLLVHVLQQDDAAARGQ